MSENENGKITCEGAVVYCDGSSLLDKKTIGWGSHGYLYDLNPDKPEIVNGYTCTNQGYIPSNRAKDETIVKPIYFIENIGSSRNDLNVTNNSAELLAVITTLDNLSKVNLKEIHILSDSEYVVKGLTSWCERWAKNNWIKISDGQPIANKELWETLYNRYTSMLKEGINITVKWVKGHANVEGNIQADLLAGIGSCVGTDTNKDINEFQFIPAKKYGKVDVLRHPFLSFRRLYFNSVKEFNQEGFYYQGDVGIPNGDFVIGKKHPGSCFSVVKLYEPDKVIESIKNKQYKTTEDNLICMIKLDRVYHKTVYPYLEKYDGECLSKYRSNANLNFMDGQPVTVEMNPVRLSMRAIDNFNYLETILTETEELLDGGHTEPIKGNNCMVHNITDTFYVMSNDKKKQLILKPEITNLVKDVKIDVPEEYENETVMVPITVVLGLDIVSRNSLKKLETEDPSVYLITWKESPKTIRYCTCIRCKTGIGVWSNFYANKVFLTITNKK